MHAEADETIVVRRMSRCMPAAREILVMVRMIELRMVVCGGVQSGKQRADFLGYVMRQMQRHHCTLQQQRKDAEPGGKAGPAPGRRCRTAPLPMLPPFAHAGAPCFALRAQLLLLKPMCKPGGPANYSASVTAPAAMRGNPTPGG
mgnify:CR=1 FL=1